MSLKEQWRLGPPTKEFPCGGCKHVYDVQGYFYSCKHPDYLRCYYGFLDNEIPETGLKSCWEARTAKPINLNIHNRLGD